MKEADRYRKHAEDARQMAAAAKSPLEKEAWLRIAEDWLRLVQDVERREGKP
jgi:hypothetical protein